MVFLPTDVANMSLDAIGCEEILGDIEDGTRVAQVCLRNYRECLVQLLRGAHWSFARKHEPLLLLGDATGQTANVGTSVPVPWIYAYAYPNDCAALRFIPHKYPPPTSPNAIQLPSTPLTTGMAQPPGQFLRLRPARFLITRSSNYPPLQGQISWEVQGLSPQGRTIICTDVPCADAVYTSVVLYPSEWDALFRNAMVAYLAAKIALPLTKDKALGLKIRAEQIAILKSVLDQARAANANETWSSADLSVDWMNFRNGGSANMRSLMGGPHGFGDDLFCGWSPVDLGNNSAY